MNKEINPPTVKINNRSKENLDAALKYKREQVDKSHL